MKTSYFFDSLDVRVLFVINNKVEQGQRLEQSDFTFCRLTPHAIHDIGLQSKQFGKNRDDNGRISILGKPEYDSAGFM